MRVLVTGGAGYIGSHATLKLLEKGFDVVVLDNLVNGSEAALDRVSTICSRTPDFIKGDVRDSSVLDKIFSDYQFDAVLHFAGLKSVNESLQIPLEYYSVNVAGTIALLQAMEKAGVLTIVFSSSATVYGDSTRAPVDELSATGGCVNSYGRSKLIAEEVLNDLPLNNTGWRVGILRYFNPVGAHSSGLIGEDPKGPPNNLMPFICQVAAGKRSFLSIFGNDYPTKDGTGIRDYIHVADLVEGHLSALTFLQNNTGVHTWNLGTGRGYSVLELVNCFMEVTGQNIPYIFADRRQGDLVASWASTDKAELELEWKAKRGLTDMVEDAWRWQSLNPQGFE